MIQKYEGQNIHINFACSRSVRNIEFGADTFNLGYWNYGFTEPLIKKLVKAMGGKLNFWVDIKKTDGFSITINEKLQVISKVKCELGG